VITLAEHFPNIESTAVTLPFTVTCWSLWYRCTKWCCLHHLLYQCTQEWKWTNLPRGTLRGESIWKYASRNQYLPCHCHWWRWGK